MTGRLREHAGALLIYLAACVVFFPDVVLFGRTLQTRSLVPSALGVDAAQSAGELPVLDPWASAWQYEPWTYQIHDAYRRGELPLWNPHAAFGQPLAANGLCGAFVPLRLPLLLFPSPLLFDLFLLARIALAAFLAYLFLRQLDVGWLGAVVGGGLFGFCDYFVLHVNMTHVDVEIFLPAALLAAGRLARSADARAAAGVAIAVFLLLLGGNPESVALILLVGAVYALVRSDARGRTATFGAIGSVLGIALAAPLLLPTLELLANSAHAHPVTTGLAHHEARTAAILLVPEIRTVLRSGPAGDHSHLRWGAMGVIPWILAAAAVFPLRGRWRGPALFFASALTISLLKVFGVPPIQWLGRLPLLDVIVYPKYLQPIIALSLGVLAAIGIERLRDSAGRRAILGSAVVAIAATAMLLPVVRAKAVEVGEWSEVVRLVVVEIGLAAAAAAFALGARRRGAIVAIGLALVLGADLRLHVPGGRPARANPIAPAPAFVERLASEPPPIRIVGCDGVLHPNWAGAFGISDLRCLDALTIDASMAWIRRFVQPVAVDRFTGLESFPPDVFGRAIDAAGVGWIASRAPIEEHVTRFLASREERLRGALETPGDGRSIGVEPGAPFECRVQLARRDPVFRARVAAPLSSDVRVEIEPLGPRDVLMHERPTEAPDKGRMTTSRAIRLPKGKGYLEFVVDPPGPMTWVYWIDPRLVPGPPLVTPDLHGFRVFAPPGVTADESVFEPGVKVPKGIFQQAPTIVRTSVDNGGGAMELRTAPYLWDEDRARDETPNARLLWREIQPAMTVWKGTARDEGTRIDVSLDSWAGQLVLLRLVAEGGPSAWSEFGVEPFHEPLEALPSYGPVRLYRNREALPRALFVPESILANSLDEALERVAEPSFDPRRTVVLEGEFEARGSPADGVRESTARIVRYGASAVEIEVEAGAPGTLLLLDAFYPGWRGSVDGRESTILRANGAFRGVAVPAGRHVVSFEYSPASFRWGLVAAAAAAAVVLAFLIAPRRALASR